METNNLPLYKKKTNTEKQVFSFKRTHPFSKLSTIFWAGIFLLVAYFMYQNMYALFSRPDIVISNANLYQTIERPLFTLKGNSKKAASIFINGNIVTLDREGNFSYDLVFGYGINYVYIKSVSKFGKESYTTLEFYRPHEKK